MKKLSILLFIFTSLNCLGQSNDDWPPEWQFYIDNTDSVTHQPCDSTSRIHKKVLPDNYGIQYFCSGNIRSKGQLILKRSVKVIDPETKKTNHYQYLIPHGEWQVFYDSRTSVLRSEGRMKKGIQDGVWNIYLPNQQLKYRMEFYNGQIKKHEEFDDTGHPTLLVNRDNWKIFYLNNQSLLILVALLPIMLFRVVSNITTYNRIHRTNYIPMLQYWQKGGRRVGVVAMFIFWWIIKYDDEPKVRKSKTTSNYISIISLIIFAVVVLFVALLGK